MVIDFEKLMAEMPVFIKKFVVEDEVVLPPVVVEPEPPVTDPIIVGLDHVYIAEKALTSGGGRVVNGDSVAIIPDLVGKADLLYAGSLKPNLTGRPPIYHDGEINFDNEPYTLFNSKKFDKVNYPYEETLVLRVFPGTGYEQFQNDWFNDLSIGDSGMKLRAGDADGNTQTFRASDYEYFKTYVIHVLAESGKQTMWLNGRNLGSISSRTESRKLLNSVGVNTNNAQWNFIAKYVKLSRFSDKDREVHLAAVAELHGQGQLPKAPFASSVSIVDNGIQYSAKYTYNGKLPQAKSEYRWLGMVSSLADVKVISAEPTIPVSLAKQYIGVRVEVKVYDVDGKSFRFVSMPFKYK